MASRSVIALLATLVVACGTAPQATTVAPRPTVTPTMASTTTSVPATTSTPAPLATTTSLAASTPTTTAPSGLVLAATGIGVAQFGDDPDQTIAVVTGLLGAPHLDSGWGDPTDSTNEYLWPGCPGTVARVVAWEGHLGLVFTDWDESDDRTASLAEPVFAGAGLWRTSPIPTDTGVSSLDRLAVVRAAYGDRLSVSDRPDDAVGLYWFSIDGTEGPLHRIGGVRGWLFWPDYPGGTSLDGSPDETWLVAGLTSGVTCETP